MPPPRSFWQAVLVGLVAQVIDGALGMAYGISSNTFLIGIGAPPAAASGAVHVAEIFTTAFSGVSHIKFGNVDKELFKIIQEVKPHKKLLVLVGITGVLFAASNSRVVFLLKELMDKHDDLEIQKINKYSVSI